MCVRECVLGIGQSVWRAKMGGCDREGSPSSVSLSRDVRRTRRPWVRNSSYRLCVCVSLCVPHAFVYILPVYKCVVSFCCLRRARVRTSLNDGVCVCACVLACRQQDLFRVLKAYTLYRPEEGYCQAQAPIAAVLLMHMPAEVSTHTHAHTYK